MIITAINTLPSNLHVDDVPDHQLVACTISRLYFANNKFISVSSLRRRMPYILFDICDTAKAPVYIQIHEGPKSQVDFEIRKCESKELIFSIRYFLESDHMKRSNFLKLACDTLFNLSHLNLSERDVNSNSLVFYTRGSKFLYSRSSEIVSIQKTEMTMFERFANWYHGLLHSKYKGNQSILGYRTAEQ